MNAPERLFLADIQAYPDHRSVVIDRVRSIRHPIAIERAVESENFESTPNHSAYALIRRHGRA
jgi:GTP cyclohydrolase FolE2